VSGYSRSLGTGWGTCKVIAFWALFFGVLVVIGWIGGTP
jgi:hypothetical protein